MKEYTVSPNKDATRWMVELEGVAPTDTYAEKDAAIDKAKEIAAENKPSRVIVLDEERQVADEINF